MHAVVFGFLFVVGGVVAICALPLLVAAMAFLWIAAPYVVGLVDAVILFGTLFGHATDRTPGFVTSAILTVWATVWLGLREQHGLFFDNFT